MGVPKFFRYTSERYPCLNELVKQYQIPDFDNMYLDMNGIIHNCSHPDDSNPHFRITEEKIFADIFHYISILFQIIKPKKLFFMAIDGVAPRAKMNQQRGRRFRSAREAETLEEQAKAKGEVLPSEKRFDSNCITPGTVFMVRLQEQLKYFVKQKISTDPLWAKVKVVLSGHETPGEGEHKIMDYIRWARSQPDYDAGTRHCLYGLDADLIMLGMCTHEPHFALLREEVKFGRTTQRATCPEETNFFLLHLSLLRQYLEQEFIAIKDKLPFKYDIENIVDDWVLMGFLVGNDFIPNLPNMHINNDALPLLYRTYMKVLPTLDGYINETGILHLGRFEVFMQELAKIDKEKFQDTYADLKFFEDRTGRRPNAQERKEYKPNNDETFNVNIEDIKANKPDDELQSLINATDDMLLDDIDDGDYEDIDTSDEEATFNMEFKQHKEDYYMNKLDYSKVTDEVLAYQAEGYVRAIQWNLHYYYRGCPSWCWYYPHHYAPYMSDIKGFTNLKIEFELGEPFKPFEQLLAVLPSASKELLPEVFHYLMTEEDSPIVHYYPINFETDLNGKRNDWEAVVLIPFIDEVNLLSAMAPCYLKLTDEERKRNSHGPMLFYDWTSQSQGVALAPEYFSPIADCHALEHPVMRQQLFVSEDKLVRGKLPAASSELFYPGFPTMKHLKYETYMKKAKLRVFDQSSLNESIILKLIRDLDNEPNIQQVACMFLGKEIWVGWPHLTLARVVSVSNEKLRLHLLDRQSEIDIPEYSTEINAGNLHKQWISERSTIIEHNMNRLGIELGDVKIIIHAVNIKGYSYMAEGDTRLVLEPQWCRVPCGYALQAVVRELASCSLPSLPRYCSPGEAFPPGARAFLLTHGPYYGCHAEIVECSPSTRGGRVKTRVQLCAEPAPPRWRPRPYLAAQQAAAHCGLSAQMLSRLTGSVLVVMGERNNMPTENVSKINIGLNLKLNKKNQEVCGYTRRNFANSWQYSERCIQLVADYAQAYPELIDCMAKACGNDIFYEGDLWPTQIGQGKPQEVVKWLNQQPHTKATRQECGSEALEPEELKLLAESVDQQRATLAEQEKSVTLQIKLGLLYKPDLHEGNITPDPKADFQLSDRVVCVATNMTVPLGAKGTITAVYKPGAFNTVRLSDKLNLEASYQVLFDEPFLGGMTESAMDSPRLYRMLPSCLLNISFGRKLRNASREQASAPTPNLLRREDGHHSAFANYSPTKDRHTPSNETRNAATAAKPTNPQDDSTEILKCLLKISNKQSSPSSSTIKSSTPVEHNQNWRTKGEPTSQPQPRTAPPKQPTAPPQSRTAEPQPRTAQPQSRTALLQQPTAQALQATAPPQQRTAPPQQATVPPQPRTAPLQQATVPPQPRTAPLQLPTAPPQPPTSLSNPIHPFWQVFGGSQPANWRNDTNQPYCNNRGPPNLNDWNKHFKNSQPTPVPPFPNFGQPFGQGPRPSQAPFPQAPSQQYQPNRQGNQYGYQESYHRGQDGGYRGQDGGHQYGRGFSQNGGFPTVLPNVTGNFSMMPAWSNNTQNNVMVFEAGGGRIAPATAPPTLEKVNNPFVPLQVQASQRRVQNSSNQANRKNSSSDKNPLPKPVPVMDKNPVAPNKSTTVESGQTQARRQNKRKPRIAANLPFQMD